MALYLPCQNQLQFNKDVPVMPATTGVKFRSPQPIIVEKLGLGSHTPLEQSFHVELMKEHWKPAFEFSSINEDKLSMAVRLARHDLRHKKQQEEQEVIQAKIDRRDKRSVKKKVPPSQSSTNRTRNKRKDSANVNKRQERKKTSRPTTPVQAIVHMATRPIAPSSPPTRDTDPYEPVGQNNQDDRVLQEITRLRKDMHVCLSQIQEIEAVAKKGGSPVKRRVVPGTEDLPAEEQDRRRAIRAEENATRTSRTLYALQKQVKDIQDDMDKMKPEEIAKKKSKLLTRLAATHRAAVRALQAFVNQLSDVNLAQGLPRTYKELALVVRQLSLCCAQLEVAGETAVPESVTNLLRDMAAMNTAMEKELKGPLVEPGRNPDEGGGKHNRQLYPNRPAVVEVTKPARHSQGRHHTGNKENRAAEASPDRQSVLERGLEALLRCTDSNDSRRQAPSSPRSHSQVHPDVPRLPITPRTPRGQTQRAAPVRVAWDLPEPRRVNEHKPHPPQAYQHQRGVLFPSSLQNQRAKSQKVHGKRKVQRDHVMRPTTILGPNHYAEPTVSTLIKKVHPHELPQPESYPPQPRSPSPTPRSPRSPRRKVLFDAPSTFADPTVSSKLKAVPPNAQLNLEEALAPFLPPSPSHSRRSHHATPRRDVGSPRTPRSPAKSARSLFPSRASHSPFDTARREIARQVMQDREGLKRMKDREDFKNAELARFKKATADLNATDEWVRETEDRIRQKIKPLLEQAQEIMHRYEATHGAERSSLRESLSQKASEAVECNADVLADMILHDVLEDTVCELQKTEDEEVAEEIAWNMQQAPSVTNLVQRLQEMEEEQEKIRMKWATVVYEDEQHNKTAAYTDARGLEQPRTPPPIQLTKATPPPDRELTPTRTRLMRVPHPHEEADSEAIVFTRPKTRSTLDESLHLRQLHQDDSRGHPAQHQSRHSVTVAKAPLQLHVSRQMLDSIQSYTCRYEAHLKRLANNPVGDFNPWRVVDEVADAIVADCVEDIAKELEEINSDIVNHIYHSEFKHVPDEVSIPPVGVATIHRIHSEHGVRSQSEDSI